MTSERRSRARLTRLIRGALAVLVGTAVLSPARSSAQEDPSAERERVRERQAQVDLQIDALRADRAEIDRALRQLRRNVATQQAEADEARRAERAAREDVREAERAVARAEQRIAELEEATDEMVVEAFMNPPSAEMFDAFNAETISDAAIQQALLELQADADADLMDQLNAAHEDLEIEEANKQEAAREAERRRRTAEAELAQVRAAAQQQQDFAAEVEARLEQALSEAESLRRQDAELARQIQRQQEELARQLREAQQAATAAGASAPSPAPPASVQPAPGGLATARCPTGGSITVAASIGDNVQGLLNEAGQQGVPLCGWGYRDPAEQVQLRREHCGTSEYAIYQMPSSQCSPPTARPGTSMHERGLAIDFNCAGGSIVAGGSCDTFLKSRADDYGLYNLPSEIWHYSTTGN
ncbi:MAG TPA: hypothetical protein VIL48_01385 [Acidimicrobiales bacterium]